MVSYSCASEGGGDGGSSSTRSNNNSSALLDEPLQWIALAVHLDEHRRDADADPELLLQVPLESGRLYDSTKFEEALRCLQQHAHVHRQHYHHHHPPSQSNATSASAASHRYDDAAALSFGDANRSGSGGVGGGPSKKKGKVGTSRPTVPASSHLPAREARFGSGGGRTADDESHGYERNIPPPPYALTPVVLSGLITALQHQRHQQQEEEDAMRQGTTETDAFTEATGHFSEDLSSELVLHCHALRRAALRRAKIRNGRKQVRRFVPPLALTLAVVIAYLRSVRRMRSSLNKLRYVRSCESSLLLVVDARQYEATCRHAETDLWDRYGTDLLDLPDASVALAMHSVLTRPTLTRRDVEAGRRIHSNAARGPTTFDRNRQPRGQESTVNRLVREAVEKHRNPTLGPSILDVGCGVGGTLYSLLPPYANATLDRRSPATSSRSFRYRGIALSAAEVHHATQLAAHRADVLAHWDVAFEQRSFDSPLRHLQSNQSNATDPGPYTVMVAIESLSYSRNLKETIANLLSVLASGGILVIVDDVVLPSDAGRVAVDPGFRRPSLVTHNTWNSLLVEHNCTLVEGYDLTFEHEIVWTADLPSASAAKAAMTFGPAFWPLSSALNAIASSSETLWRRGVWWERWFAASAASRRMVQLHDDRAEHARAARKRVEEYQVRDSLSYHLYVCRKQ
jgi:SAM-dependent methyltransferase